MLLYIFSCCIEILSFLFDLSSSHLAHRIICENRDNTSGSFSLAFSFINFLFTLDSKLMTRYLLFKDWFILSWIKFFRLWFSIKLTFFLRDNRIYFLLRFIGLFVPFFLLIFWRERITLSNFILLLILFLLHCCCLVFSWSYLFLFHVIRISPFYSFLLGTWNCKNFQSFIRL